MKKVLTIIILSLNLAACNSNSGNQTGADSSNIIKKDAIQQVAITADDTSKPKENDRLADKGFALIAKSDCMSCHKKNQKLVGPAFQDIARKYKGDATAANRLSDKIIKGGSGVWGEAAMNAHPNLAKAETKVMVEYILHIDQ